MKKKSNWHIILLNVILVLTLLISCDNSKIFDNFMTGEDDFKEELVVEVEVANAAETTVTIKAENDSMGTSSPFGSYTTKLNVAFAITTTVDADYEFVKWTQTGGVGTEVVFDDATSKSTNATVTSAGSDIAIVATFDKKPYVVTWSPYSGTNDNLINKDITVTFNEEISSDSITLSETGSIQITTVKTANITTATVTHVESDFSYSINEKALTINLNDNQYHEKYSTISILLTSDIEDLSGNKMVEDFSWFFETGSGKDESAPWLTSFEVGTYTTVSQAYTNLYSPSYIISVDDNSGSSAVTQMQIITTPWNSGELGGGSSGTETVYDAEDFETDFTKALPGTADGWYKVRINVADTSGNWSTTDTEDSSYDPDASDTEVNTKYIYLDRTAPTISTFGISGGTGYTNSTDYIITLDYPDYSDGTYSGVVSYSLTNNTSTANWKDISGLNDERLTWALHDLDGAQTIYFSVKDEVGNISETKTYDITLDRIAPTYTLSLTANTVKSGDKTTITASFSETVVTPTINLSGSGITSISSGIMENPSGNIWTYEWTATGTGSGDITIGFTATDDAGNPATMSSGDTLKIDNTSPTYILSETKESVMTGSKTIITASFSETVVTPTISLSGSGITPISSGIMENSSGNYWSYEWTATGTGTGTVSIDVSTEDLVGNNANRDSSDTNSLTVDNTPPTYELSKTNEFVKTGNKTTITASFSETVVTPTISLSGSGITPISSGIMENISGNIWTYEWTATGTGNGLVTIGIDGSDVAGNSAILSAGDNTLTIDNTAPAYTLDITDTLIKKGDTTTITASFNDDVGTPTISLSGSGITSISSGIMENTSGNTWTYDWTATGTGNGLVTIGFAATDTAGNDAVFSSGDSLTLDNTAPTYTLEITDTLIKKGDTTTITASFNDDVGTPTISLSGSGITSISSGIMENTSGNTWTYDWTATGTGNGLVTIGFAATDTTGNDAVFSSGDSLTLDNTAPDIGIILTPTPITTSSAQFKWTGATDSSTPITYIVYYSQTEDDVQTISSCEAIDGNEDNGSTTSTSSLTASATGLDSDEKYYFNIIVKDSLGNSALYSDGSDNFTTE